MLYLDRALEQNVKHLEEKWGILKKLGPVTERQSQMSKEMRARVQGKGCQWTWVSRLQHITSWLCGEAGCENKMKDHCKSRCECISLTGCWFHEGTGKWNRSIDKRRKRNVEDCEKWLDYGHHVWSLEKRTRIGTRAWSRRRVVGSFGQTISNYFVSAHRICEAWVSMIMSGEQGVVVCGCCKSGSITMIDGREKSRRKESKVLTVQGPDCTLRSREDIITFLLNRVLDLWRNEMHRVSDAAKTELRKYRSGIKSIGYRLSYGVHIIWNLTEE